MSLLFNPYLADVHNTLLVANKHTQTRTRTHSSPVAPVKVKVKVAHTRLPSVAPELIPVLGSQPAGDVSHKPGGRLPLLSARPAVSPQWRMTIFRALGRDKLRA